MSNPTILLSDVEIKSGEKNGKAWTKWNFRDGNHELVGATFSAEIGNAAIALKGQRVELDLEAAKDPKFAPTVTAVRPAPEKPKADGEVDWDSKERRDFRSRAWAQAITAMQHTGKGEETPKQVFERVKPLAHAIYLDVVGDFAQAPPEEPELSPRDSAIPF